MLTAFYHTAHYMYKNWNAEDHFSLYSSGKSVKTAVELLSLYQASTVTLLSLSPEYRQSLNMVLDGNN